MSDKAKLLKIKSMKLLVKNIVSEIDLKPADAFLPLFECISNSIISLIQSNDLKKEEKKISIEINRGDFPQKINILGIKNINSFRITDNGLGFTDKNYESFSTAYTDENKKYGCKGIGRFTILAAYKQINIISNYKKGTDIWQREFKFDPETEITPIKNSKIDKGKIETIIEISECYNLNIKDYTAKTAKEIAELIMEQCLVYYLSGKLPVIELTDNENKEFYNINELYSRLSDKNEKDFKVREFKFNCYITREKKFGNRANHYIYYCANSRVVGKARSLANVNSVYANPILDNGVYYYLDVYIVSEYLDKKVYPTRNGFSIPTDRINSLFGDIDEITFPEIEETLAEILKTQLLSFVQDTQERSKKELINYIQTQAPRFMRYVHDESILNSIPANLSDEKKEEHLNKIAYQEGEKINKKMQEIIEKKEISEHNINEIIADIKLKTIIDTDSLTDYMCRRKAIIKIFKKFLEADKTNKYKLENDIHNLIIPMGVTHKDINYDTHNLWLLDERFATYSFIASDKPITTFSQKKSGNEPDIIMIERPEMFENPISFSSEASGELSSMVIFEFKRPGETAHNKNKTDYRWEYSELIEKYFDDFLIGEDKKKKNYLGRPVILRDNTPKFGFIIVDVIPTQLEEFNKKKGWKKTPFGTHYKINPDLNLHIEVITFDQLIKSVETRHAPFFDKLFNK